MFLRHDATLVVLLLESQNESYFIFLLVRCTLNLLSINNNFVNNLYINHNNITAFRYKYIICIQLSDCTHTLSLIHILSWQPTSYRYLARPNSTLILTLFFLKLLYPKHGISWSTNYFFIIKLSGLSFIFYYKQLVTYDIYKQNLTLFTYRLVPCFVNQKQSSFRKKRV